MCIPRVWVSLGNNNNNNNNNNPTKVILGNPTKAIFRFGIQSSYSSFMGNKNMCKAPRALLVSNICITRLATLRLSGMRLMKPGERLSQE